jgi:tRNA (cmo5U34)-methyltransferase
MSDTATLEQWTEAESEGFIDWGEFFVPQRARQMAIICDLIPDVEGEVVEICSGQGLLARAVLEHLPNARVRALDGSPAMLSATAQTLAPFAGRFELGQIDIARQDWRSFAAPVRAFVSSLAIHHLDGPGKLALFHDLYRALAPGGALIIADVILTAGAAGEKLAGRAWDEAVRQRSVEVRGDLSAFETFVDEAWNMFTNPLDAVDKPSTLVDQLTWLRAAGFRDVDLHWMDAGHAIFSGYK